jgi:hypothetical protein
MESMAQSMDSIWNNPYGFYSHSIPFHMDSMDWSMESIVKVLILVILVEFEN